MGNELAIPHGTNETKDTILGSALSVVRYDGGVDWDGEPVTFVVGIAGKGDEHLEILSRSRSSSPTRTTVRAARQARPTAGGAATPCVSAVNESMKAVHFGAGQHRPRLRRAAPARGRLRAGVLGRRRRRSSTRISGIRRYTVHEVGEGGRDTRRRPASARSTARRTRRRCIDEIATAERRHHRRRADDPAVRRPAHRRGACAARPADAAAAADHGVRERDQRHRPAARRDRVALEPPRSGTRSPRGRCSRTPRSTASCRRRPPARGSTSPSSRSSSGRSSVRRSATTPPTSRARTSSTTSRRTSSASSSP